MTLLAEKRFRANPGYELLLREQRTGGDDALPRLAQSDEPLYGYLRPKPSANLPWRAVSPDTALLFLTLRREGAVPDYFRSLFGWRADNRLLQLVLDRVLEVEHEGDFVSGPRARKPLFGDEAYSGKGLIVALSIEALRYVEALGDLDIPEMTHRLYGFGRRPVTSARRRLLDRAGIATFSGFLGSVPPALDRYWTISPIASAHWVMWRPIRSNSDSEPARFKLYVSPSLSHVTEAFAASAEILGQSAGVRGMKLGRGVTGLTRPDKLDAYFSRHEDLQVAGANLHRQLGGCPVHGVPFTSGLSTDGLLSWGADRPQRRSDEPESWRLWIARKIASHFDTARKGDYSGPNWQFVLERLRVDGVNPEIWAPSAEFWREPGVGA